MTRLVGVLLMLLGAVALGYQGFTPSAGWGLVDVGPDRERSTWAAPLVGGVSVVAGFAFLASGGRWSDPDDAGPQGRAEM